MAVSGELVWGEGFMRQREEGGGAALQGRTGKDNADRRNPAL
jgi:hypothetical protein